MGKIKIFYILLLSVAVFGLSACRSSKKATHHQDEYRARHTTVKDAHYNDLSKKLSVTVDKSDDIALLTEIAGWMGTPYRYGGATKQGADCSGFVSQVYKSVYGIQLMRNSAAICKSNCKKIEKDELGMGDLVFFATSKDRSRINHVGIYLKEGKFAHASSSKGVIVSSMELPYYQRTYVSSGRVSDLAYSGGYGSFSEPDMELFL